VQAARDRDGSDPSPAQINTQSDCSFWSAHFALRLLDGPVLDVDDRTFQAGDRVLCLKIRAWLGVLNGELTTVTGIDTDRRTVTLWLDRTGQPVTVPCWYLDDGHLDREWIYVTMSRGQEANTIYLTEPELGNDECEHLTHQRPDRISTLIAALARTATEPAALDTGRGPKIRTDEQLERRLAEAQDELAASGAGGLVPAADDVPKESFIEYLNLEREIRDRHRDRLATITYQPHDWVTDSLGERPADPERRAVWDTVVDRALRYRTDHGIPEDAPTSSGHNHPAVISTSASHGSQPGVQSSANSSS